MNHLNLKFLETNTNALVTLTFTLNMISAGAVISRIIKYMINEQYRIANNTKSTILPDLVMFLVKV